MHRYRLQCLVEIDMCIFEENVKINSIARGTVDLVAKYAPDEISKAIYQTIKHQHSIRHLGFPLMDSVDLNILDCSTHSFEEILPETYEDNPELGVLDEEIA